MNSIDERAKLQRCRKLAYAALIAGDEQEYEKWMRTVRTLAKKYPKVPMTHEKPTFANERGTPAQAPKDESDFRKGAMNADAVRKKRKPKKMRRVRDIEAADAVADLEAGRPPKGMPTSRWRAGAASGRREGKQLAWYRGHHAGIYDAYLTVKTKHPRVAEELLRCHDLNKDGSYR